VAPRWFTLQSQPDNTRCAIASAAGRALPVVTDAERAVADLLPIDADPTAARRALARVPLWFHTFALNREHGLYTPGVARDHRYRVASLPLSFAGQRVLDVGTFDGFYAFLAEHRGAAETVAVDNEQHVAWVRARWGIELRGGEGFATIAELLGSRVQYRRGDATALVGAVERFDVVLCFGILHRVENPLGLLRRLAALLAPGGRLLVETYGIASDARLDAHTIEVQQAGGVYAGDDYVYWGFGAGGLSAIAQLAGLTNMRVDATTVVDGHPRIMATLAKAT
jgi:tRNA (mo5U34)-methyltransferase